MQTRAGFGEVRCGVRASGEEALGAPEPVIDDSSAIAMIAIRDAISKDHVYNIRISVF